jgi:hypothetical protein
MRIHLSALGWIDDAPRGHRLRWHYPLQALTAAGGYLGLPEKIIVERAPLDSQDFYDKGPVSAAYPYSWWQSLPDISIFGFVAPHEHTLASPVQAIRFNYQGSPARIVIRDSANGGVAFDRLVSDGDEVYAEGVLIDSFAIYGLWSMLKQIFVLDLFLDHGLTFEPIAEIAVADTYGQSLAAIAKRYDQPTTIGAAEWNDLVTAVADANASSPATEVEGTPTAWDTVQVLLGLRWEYALLGGFGFFDGPRSDSCVLDQLGAGVLHGPPGVHMAYRARDASGPAGHSNLSLCAPWPASALAAPNAPWYVNPEVRLREGKTVFASSSVISAHASLANFVPLLTFDGDYTVRTTSAWQQNDARALGVEMEEAVSPSPATGAAGRTTTFMSRSHNPDDPPMQATLARVFDVSFIDVTLRSRVRAIDAWDRVSAYSAWSGTTPLNLRHEPMAPPLETATYTAGTARIMRAVGRPGVPDWQPDPIVKHAAGEVHLYRRTTKPRVANVTASAPLALSPGLYRVNVTGASTLSDFVGGTLSVGSFSDTVVAASGSSVDIAIPDNGGAVTLFSAGAGRLSQDPLTPALWTYVAKFPAIGLPTELVFSDLLPVPSGLAIESYSSRVAFLGRVGPFGNIATAIRQPAVPVVPPPFVVDVLGLDFYRRTMIKLRFTTPPGSGRYTIWWADGTVDDDDFPRRGAAGRYGAQQPANGDVLYDVLPLPIPAHLDRTVTIGVQQVLEGGVQGNFVTAPVVLPALMP